MITSEITMGQGLRPCALCGMYVPAYGCEHWRRPDKPRTYTVAQKQRKKTYDAQRYARRRAGKAVDT